jgi:hypothetical protein
MAYLTLISISTVKITRCEDLGSSSALLNCDARETHPHPRFSVVLTWSYEFANNLELHRNVLLKKIVAGSIEYLELVVSS